MCLLLLICLVCVSREGKTQDHPGEWRHWGGDAGGQRYSPLDQINRANLSKLTRAWTYHTGDVSDGSQYRTLSCFEGTPLMAEGILYVTTPFARVVALDPETGKELWAFDPKIDRDRRYNLFINRGAAYWSDGKDDQRLFFGTLEGKLFCLKAANGKPCSDFGEGGIVDMKKKYASQYPRQRFGITSAPAIYKNLVIPSILVEAPVGPSPAIRAFDVRSGEQIWKFNTIPQPGEFGHETWGGDSWKQRSGANAWITASVDEARRMVFLATGAAAYDYYGGDRPGQNLFANTVLALNGDTGKRIWHFQTVHHDLWDYDIGSQPNLVSLMRNGKRVDAVAQVTKMGFVFVLDRETGEPIFGVEERPVPRSTVPGEHSWPTQPFPVKPPPIARQSIRREQLSRVTPDSAEKAARWFEKVKTGPMYSPPGLEPLLFFPGLNGGANWPGASFDPTTGWLYTSVSNLGTVIQMVDAGKKSPLAYVAQFPTFGIARRPFFRDQETLWPLQEPPWGTLVAVDLNGGEIVWEKPLGTVQELDEAGHPPTGTPNLGGVLTTAGGLLFVGGTPDSRFRAFDKKTGKVLWETEVDAPAFASPMTYLGPTNGKQYIVIAAGGGNKYTHRFSDALIAFALEDLDAANGSGSDRR